MTDVGGLEPNKRAEVTSRTPEFMAAEASKPFGWPPAHFVEWATVQRMIDGVGLRPGARVLDVGCGTGWCSLFLAEAGFTVTGLDLVPANIELARTRAERWGSRARFEVADMERLVSGEPADAVLLLDALHHSLRPAAVLGSVAGALAPGGWLLLGEPTWLHRLSPEAHRASRRLGWLERGFTYRGLRGELRQAGFGELRRFRQPTSPYEDGLGAFAWQLTRLLTAQLWVAPQSHLWIAARRAAA